MKLSDSATLDEVLSTHESALGGDFAGYRNHACRVFNLCLALSPESDDARQSRIAIAAAFHDIGIWTAGTFDYIEPSTKLATAHLAQSGHSAWAPEIETSSCRAVSSRTSTRDGRAQGSTRAWCNCRSRDLRPIL